jgi:histidinol-phosphate/aromatic aminotransferase/cobyric acid decarboxylase-like protein
LQRNDIHVHAAAAPMLLIKVGDSPRLQQRLWQRGFLVRDGSSYHLPEWIRVCPRPADDFDPFIEALKEELR